MFVNFIRKLIKKSFFFYKKHDPNKNSMVILTLAVCVLRLLSVAKPLPQMLQWKGLFLARSTWASWLRRCCCKFDSWMKARPQSGRWHL